MFATCLVSCPDACDITAHVGTKLNRCTTFGLAEPNKHDSILLIQQEVMSM